MRTNKAFTRLPEQAGIFPKKSRPVGIFLFTSDSISCKIYKEVRVFPAIYTNICQQYFV
jgi:hypothetical protein